MLEDVLDRLPEPAASKLRRLANLRDERFVEATPLGALLCGRVLTDGQADARQRLS